MGNFKDRDAEFFDFPRMGPEVFESLLPLAASWAQEQEAVICREGVPLTQDQIEQARALGIAHPEKVRLLYVENIPLPEDPVLRAAAEATQLLTPHTAGLTVRYGIFVRSDCRGQKRLVFHELVHTSQYERMGGFLPFLRQYLLECLTIGYPAAPMEQEAITKTAEYFGKDGAWD